jgi:hypothetical protein
LSAAAPARRSATYQGEPETSAYLKCYADEQVPLEHVVRPGLDPADNPYHFVAVRVDGADLSPDVVGVNWAATQAVPVERHGVEVGAQVRLVDIVILVASPAVTVGTTGTKTGTQCQSPSR